MNAPHRSTDPHAKGQVVLVLQGGGALGAYQAGVYEALHESGVAPDWVTGTSIGAISGALMSLECLNATRTRLTVGAVNVRSGSMRYFDSRDAALTIDHIMASGALPPAFPAIRIDGEPYWDGGVYSNTPIEAVLDDKPRRDSVIFGVNVWQPVGAEPQSIWQVLGRQKDIQYASRADSHIARQKQIHHLRHVISELAALLPPEVRDSMHCRELTSWGCRTTMHVVRLLAPTPDSQDYLKDIDFTPAGIRARWQAGLADTRRMIERAPWETEVDQMGG